MYKRQTCRWSQRLRKEAAKNLEPEPWTKMKVIKSVTMRFSYPVSMECLAWARL